MDVLVNYNGTNVPGKITGIDVVKTENCFCKNEKK